MENKKTKNMLSWFFTTKIGLLCVTSLMTAIFLILSDFYDWAIVGVYIFGTYPIVLIFVMIVYAYIINPIRSRKKNINSNK